MILDEHTGKCINEPLCKYCGIKNGHFIKPGEAIEDPCWLVIFGSIAVFVSVVFLVAVAIVVLVVKVLKFLLECFC